MKEEPQGVGAVTIEEAIQHVRLKDSKAIFHCNRCGEPSVYGEPHHCRPLTKRQQRRLRAQQRLSRIKTEVPCDECGKTGRHTHWHPNGPTDGEIMAQRLREAGYSVEKHH
jgi:endogenous inhibitor of DNA gyrase (YacG/DUF329 family)